MYAVVGCSECDALWIVEGRPETTTCRRCGKRHRFGKLKTFAETDDETAAREARSRLLAEREGAEVDSFAAMDERAGPAVDDEEYLAGSGIDPWEVADAGGSGGESMGRREVVRAALADLDAPTADAVVAYAARHDVPEEYAREALDRLVRAGEAVEDGGEYRPL